MGQTGMDRNSAAASGSAVTRNADALVFSGALVRDSVPALWRQLQPLRAGIRTLDLGAVSLVDSAGLALLTELAGDGATDDGLEIIGSPSGLGELRAAYRLDERLAFNS